MNITYSCILHSKMSKFGYFYDIKVLIYEIYFGHCLMSIKKYAYVLDAS